MLGAGRAGGASSASGEVQLTRGAEAPSSAWPSVGEVTLAAFTSSAVALPSPSTMVIQASSVASAP
jgi:hypothetical protein